MARESRPLRQRQVAIIGYGLRLPGANGRDAFWRMLSERRCAVSQIPSDRFAPESFYHPHAGADVPGRSYTFAAGLIDNVWDFDPGVFGISPREAAQVDPQQRHLLEVTYEAIEHAGLRPSRLAGENIGVYVGASSSDHASRFMFDPSAVDMHMMTGNTLSLISNRLSYAFDLHGPSFTVDTACSSSLVAMHVALEAIRDGKIDTAIVGGVNMLLAPFSFLGFSRASMLSPTGLCRAFDAAGDGYVRGEGAVALILRAEDAARRNGDRIHALVVGSGTNQDGRTVGLSLPSADAQAALLKQVYESCGVSANDLAFVEAHGTGTKVGDPAEAEALGRVIGKDRASALPIGSVKTNIGHLEPASGLAGVVKSILALEHEVLPASLHFNEPNPDIRFDDLNLRVAGEPVAIRRGRKPRHAGVNSFGFGGSNAHVVLREAERVAPPAINAQAPLILSAHGKAALKSLVARYDECLQRGDAAAVANAAAYTRDLLPERMVVAPPRGGRLADGDSTVWQGTAIGNDLDVAFVFSGNGAQWAGMGLAAHNADAAFRNALERFDESFKPIAGWSVVDALHSPDLPIEIRRASRAQPLLLAVQVATVEALRMRGIEPSTALGHSVGEIAAAWCAGALDLKAAIRVVLARSQRQEITRYRGAMAAALVSAGDMEALLGHGTFPDLEVAAINSNRSVTVAGPRAAIDSFLKYAEQERWGVRRLDLDYPFHCALVDPIESQLIEDLAGLVPNPTHIPFVSTVTGDVIPGGRLDAHYWWRNVREPVDFAGGIAALIERGTRVFVEIGPHPVLSGYLHEAFRSSGIQGAVIPTLSRDGKETDELLAATARVLVAGGRVDIDRFIGPAQRPAIALPGYAWQHRRFKLERTGEALPAFAAPAHALLGQETRAGSNAWYATVDPQILPWLGDHRVENAVVFPAAGFIEIALASARHTFGDVALEVRDLEILQPIVMDGDRSFEISTRLSGETNTLEVRSRPRPAEGEPALNAKATLGTAPVAQGRERFDPLASASLDMDDVYALAQRRGLVYGPAFRRIASVEIVDERNARAVLAGNGLGGFVLDPTAIDAAFHLLISLAEYDPEIDPSALLLPVRLGSLRVYRAGAAIASATARITSSTRRSQVADFLLFDQAGELVAELREARCRIVSRSVKETADDLVYRTGFEFLHRAGSPSAFPDVFVDGPARVFSDAARIAGDVGEHADVALVLDAGARAAAFAAVAELAGSDGLLSISDLVAEGRVAMSAWPLLSQMLLSLADAGLARELDKGWELLPQADAPDVAELVDVLVARYPSWIAEATCLARLPDLLPALLRDGLDHGLGFGQATLDHLERGSPAAARLAGVVHQGASEILQRWPADRPLQVLVVGAANLPLAASIAAQNTRANVVVADPRADYPDAARRSPFSDDKLRITPWDEATDPAAGYDLILCAGSLHRVVAAPGRFDLMTQTLRSGGVLVAAEPAPSLFLDLVYGQTTDWWARSINPDFPAGTIVQERDWAQTLQEAGFADETVQTIEGGVLVSASLKRDRVPSTADVVARSMIVVADAEGQTFADLLHQRLQHAARVVPFHSVDGRMQRRVRKATLAEVPAELRAGPPVSDVVLVTNARASADSAIETMARSLSAMTQIAAAAAGNEARFCLWLVCSGALGGVVDQRAANPVQTGLWMAARVIQNEFPDIDIRCIDLDPQLATDLAASRAAETIAHPSADREIALGAHGDAVLRVLRGGLLSDDADGDAVRLEFPQAGAFDSFAWRPVRTRALADDHVEIAVAATGLNFRDVMWSLGLLPDEALENGFTGPAIGMECAGTVTAVGKDVKTLRVGDRVVAFATGAFASSVAVDARMAVRVPDEISLEAAATLPVAFLTAWYALVHLARLEPGETVLIHGGAGGVGLAALQIAKLRGAKVIATAGNADRRALLQTLGADHVFDSRSLTFADDTRRVCGGVDVVLNSLAGEAMERSIDCLKPFGRFLELGKRDFYQNRHLGMRPFRNNLSYFGIDADQLLLGNRALAERMFAELMVLFADGQLVPLPYRAFEAEHASDAFRLMQRSGQIGKVIVRPPHSRPQAPARSAFRIDPRGQYLIVGGLGGFGLATAEWLAAKGARHLALMSRSGRPSSEAAGIIAGLKASGITVDIVAADVADAAALERYLWTLDGGPALKGVFHAAMVLDDGFAADLDRARIEKVLWPKVAGAANLDRLTRRFDLDCFVMFSSVAAMVGNVGQTSYVAANGYLEGLARQRRAEGLPALAVGFGAIGDVGYLARNVEAGAALSQRLGRATLAAAEALDGLEALLESDPHDVSAAAVVFARMDWALARKELKLVRSPLFGRLQLEDLAGEASSIAAAELLELLRDLPDIEVQAKLADLIAESIVRTLRLPSGEVDRNRALSEFGMDSLMMLELRMAVEEQIGIEIPLMSLTSSLSIADISKRLTAILRSQDKALMSGQMSVLVQEHVEIPAMLSDADVAATAAAVARRAKSVDRIL